MNKYNLNTFHFQPKPGFFKNRVSYILGLLLICMVCFNGYAQRDPEHPVTGKTIVMFGNSITFQGKWEEALNRKDVVNWGIPGYLTGQLIWTIKDVLKRYPDTKIWFLEGGINDITLGVPVERIFENQIIMIDSLKLNHIIPVVQSTILKNGAPAHNKQVYAANKKIKKYCEQHKIDYIDLNVIFSSNGELRKEITTDGCHLIQQAYKPWGELVLKTVKKYNL